MGVPPLLFHLLALVGVAAALLRGRSYPVSVWLTGAAFVVLAWGVWPSFIKLGVDINRYVFFADRGDLDVVLRVFVVREGSRR